MSDSARPFGLAKTILYSLLPVTLLLVVLEGGARVRELWYPPMDVDLGQGFTNDSLLFAPDPFNHDFRVTHPRKTINFVEQRFAAVKEPGTLRIAALGGSSVNYLQWEFTQWSERLKQELPQYNRIEIINCGGESYGSHRLVLLAAEVLLYDVDVMIFYEAHNEFEELEQLDVANVELVAVQRKLEFSALYRLFRDIAASAQIRQLEKESGQSALAAKAPDTMAAWRHQFTPEEIATRMQVFKANLSKIAHMCRDKGVPLVIGTVPSNLWKAPPGSTITRWNEVQTLYDAGNYRDGLALAETLLRNAVRHQASEAENEIIREMAAIPGIYVADVKAAVIAREPHGVPGETLFNDHCHLNPEGNRILVDTFQPPLQEALSAWSAAP